MAIPTNIKTLLSGEVVEWARIEFKETWNPAASLKSVCAFANDRVNHQAEMSDLNITLIQNYLKEVKSSLYEKSKTGDFIEVCQDMNIVSTLPEYTKPKNVGLMFFSMEPDKFFPYTQIDVVQFPSGLGGDDIIEKTFKGPIQQQLRDVLQYIRNVVITEKIIKYPDRAESDRSFNFPYAAIEEALSNAVYT